MIVVARGLEEGLARDEYQAVICISAHIRAEEGSLSLAKKMKEANTRFTMSIAVG